MFIKRITVNRLGGLMHFRARYFRKGLGLQDSKEEVYKERLTKKKNNKKQKKKKKKKKTIKKKQKKKKRFLSPYGKVQP